MFKGFLAGFIILSLLAAFGLYAYGKRMMTNMTTVQTDAYVDKTLEKPTTTQNWTDYLPTSNKFRAKFPTVPQHATDRSKDDKTNEMKEYEMYISESDGKVFMISVISFLNTDKIKDEEAVLRNIIEDMVTSNPGNKLEKIQYGTYEGLKSSNFSISNNAYAITGQAFIDKNQLYVLSVLSKTASESQNVFDYFVKSFNLNNQNIKG